MTRAASPIAWFPVAQAVTTAEFGPFAPKRMEMSPEAMLMMSIGMKNGDTRSGPLASRTLWLSSSVLMPPMPDPTRVPKRVPSISSTFRPASSTAICAQASAYFRKGSSFRSSFRSMNLRASKPLTSPAIRVGNALASKRVMGPMPDRPSINPAQNSSAVLPRGVTAPRPVMTTRCAFTSASASCLHLLLDVADGVADRRDLLGVLVGDLEAELLLERHHELDGVQGVGVEVLDELGLHRDLVRPHSQVVTDDLAYPLFHRLRRHPCLLHAPVH